MPLSRRELLVVAGATTVGRAFTSLADTEPPMSQDLRALSLTDLAAALRRGDLSSETVTRSYLDRIEAVNPRLNAVVQVRREAALREAQASRRPPPGATWRAPRRSGHDQGLARHGRHRLYRRDPGTRGLCPDGGRDRGAAHAGGGRHRHGQDEHPRPHPGLRDARTSSTAAPTTPSTSSGPRADRAEAPPPSWPRGDRLSTSAATPGEASACLRISAASRG